jgi:hypothetical protein
MSMVVTTKTFSGKNTSKHERCQKFINPGNEQCTYFEGLLKATSINTNTNSRTADLTTLLQNKAIAGIRGKRVISRTTSNKQS